MLKLLAVTTVKRLFIWTHSMAYLEHCLLLFNWFDFDTNRKMLTERTILVHCEYYFTWYRWRQISNDVIYIFGLNVLIVCVKSFPSHCLSINISIRHKSTLNITSINRFYVNAFTVMILCFVSISTDWSICNCSNWINLSLNTVGCTSSWPCLINYIQPKHHPIIHYNDVYLLRGFYSPNAPPSLFIHSMFHIYILAILKAQTCCFSLISSIIFHAPYNCHWP